MPRVTSSSSPRASFSAYPTPRPDRRKRPDLSWRNTRGGTPEPEARDPRRRFAPRAARVAQAAHLLDRGAGIDDPPLPPRFRHRHAARGPHWLVRTALSLAVLRSAADAASGMVAAPDMVAAPPAHGTAVPDARLYADVCRDANWDRLSTNEKAGRALACATTSTDAGLVDAIRHVRDCREWAVMAWREGGDRAARENAWRAAERRTRETLHVLTELAMFAEETPEASRAQVDARAHALLAEARAESEDGEALYARQLALDTDDWLDIDALHRWSPSPVDLLSHTYRWCGSKLSDALTPAYLSRGAFDRCAVELAALLDARLAGDAPTLKSVTGLAPFVATFEQQLRRDVCVRWWGGALLPASSAPRGLTPVWFDGNALHGATGLDFHRLVARLTRRHEVMTEVLSKAYAAAPGDCRALTNVTLGDIVLDRLKVVAESTDYPFGTPHQSLATVLLRLGPLHGVNPFHVDEPDRLFERYAALEAAWAAAPRYPVAPHVAAAFHLARSSGVFIRDDRPIDTQVLDIVRQEYAPWINVTDANVMAAWRRVRASALRDVHPAGEEAKVPLMTLTALRAGAGEYRRLMSLPQRWVVPPGRDGARALATYLAQRLLAYGAPPTCVEMVFAHGAGCPAQNDTQGAIRSITVARQRETAFLRRADAHFHARTNPRRAARAVTTGLDRPPPAVPGTAVTLETLAPDDDAPELRAFLDRLLIISSLAEQARRPGATVLDFVPFVGSAYTLGKGLCERDGAQALRGAFGFGLDALFVWLGGATERMVSRQVARLANEVGLAPHEPAALAMLADVGAHLDVARPGALPAGNVVVDSNPSGLSRWSTPRVGVSDDEGVSLSLEQGTDSPASMATLAWEDALTSRHASFSSVDDPSSSDGGAAARVRFPAIRQSRRETRTPRPSRPGESSKPRARSLTPLRVRVSCLGDTVRGARAGHRGGERDTSQPSDLFLSRSTVAKAQAFIKARDFITRIGGESNGDAMPELNDVLRVAEHASDTTVRDFQRVCHALETFGKGSHTLRALLRFASKERRDPASRFTVRFLAGTPPRCDLQRGLIVLPPVDAPFDVDYVDARGSTRFQRERAWLHELVHALTGIEDVADEDRVAHRGAVVYFTDRILFEAGPEVPERIMYRHARPFFASGIPREPEPVIEAARRDAAVTTLAEDVFLDELLRSRMKWGPAETILGVPVERRLTVRQVTALRRAIAAPDAAADTRPLPDIQARLGDLFQTALDEDDDLPGAIARSGNLVKAVATLYERDTSFRFFFNRWYRTQMRGPDWQVRGGVATDALPRGWTIDRVQRRLALYEDRVFYASQLGPRRLEPDRRLVGALVDLVVPPDQGVAPEAERRLNRGLRVYLENRALQTLRAAKHMLDAPARVSAEWSGDATSLWKSVNKAHRAAQAEDALLAAHQDD